MGDKYDDDETLPNIIKGKHQKNREKKSKGQKPKSKQTSSPNKASHKKERVRLKQYLSLVIWSMSTKERGGKANKTQA